MSLCDEYETTQSWIDKRRDESVEGNQGFGGSIGLAPSLSQGVSRLNRLRVTCSFFLLNTIEHGA
jgi:hypothetical protein